MKRLFALITAVVPFVSTAAVRYVDLNSPSPTSPYTSWSTAATNIQDAIDVAIVGDRVLVTNGVYRAGPGSIVVVNATNAIIIESVNGPAETLVDGDASLPCASLTGGAMMRGCTLTNGYGGVGCESAANVLSNCVLVGNSDGGAVGGTLYNCVISQNFRKYGGGAYGSILVNCLVSSNSAEEVGGGIYASVATNCILVSNFGGAGGAGESTLYGCLVYNNTGYDAGGGYYCTFDNCTLSNNWAFNGGGGANLSTLNFCTLTGNFSGTGGAVQGSTLNGCVLRDNSAFAGGAIYGGSATNCAIIENRATNDGGGAECFHG